MFLWVRLVLDVLQNSFSERELLRDLQALPKDLETLYVRNSG